MSTEVFETVQKLSQKANDSMRSFCEINAGVATQIAEQQLAFCGLVSDFNAKQMDLIANTSSYKELASAESTAVKQFSENASALARGTLDIVSESRQEISNWFEKGVELASSSASATASAVKASPKKSS
ncbi:MAG: phasin family protein [Candidatus Eutrophobiaceae bacterium]